MKKPGALRRLLAAILAWLCGPYERFDPALELERKEPR